MSESKNLKKILKDNLDQKIWDWFSEKLTSIIKNESSKDFFLMYSICSIKIKSRAINFDLNKNKSLTYLKIQKTNLLELSRIYLLLKVLKEKNSFFLDKVKKLIQIADKEEIETFLKY